MQTTTSELSLNLEGSESIEQVEEQMKSRQQCEENSS